MVLPLYATLSRLDLTLLEAAADLGCRPWRAFVRVTLPLSLPGILAGSLLVFIPAVGEFVIPDLLGGPDSLMVGRMLWTEFFSNKDWPLASALALVLLALLVVPFVALQRWQSRLEGESMKTRRWPIYSLLAFGYAFLYVPVLLLVIYSFNASRLVTVWGGFSTHWYGELLRNTQILDAAWLSVRIATVNATLAVVLGTPGGHGPGPVWALSWARRLRTCCSRHPWSCRTSSSVCPSCSSSSPCSRLSAGPTGAASPPSPSPTSPSAWPMPPW
jgi:ABC-type spermidine/putrescine transport system permease subunit I